MLKLFTISRKKQFPHNNSDLLIRQHLHAALFFGPQQ